MIKNRDFIVEAKKAIIGNLPFGIIKAFADEPENPNPGSGGEGEKEAAQPTINYEDLIARARKEEKQKQYSTIEKLKAEKETLIKQHNDDLIKITELEEKVKEVEAKVASASNNDSEAVKTLKDEIVNLNKEKADLEAKLKEFEGLEVIDRDAIANEVRAELESEYEVKTYRVEQMSAHRDDILVPELVIGNTKEEIDNSIKAAIERSNEIKKSLGATAPVGTPRTPGNPSTEGTLEKEISLEKLASMNPASDEYKELRQKLGLR